MSFWDKLGRENDWPQFPQEFHGCMKMEYRYLLQEWHMKCKQLVRGGESIIILLIIHITLLISWVPFLLCATFIQFLYLLRYSSPPLSRESLWDKVLILNINDARVGIIIILDKTGCHHTQFKCHRIESTVDNGDKEGKFKPNSTRVMPVTNVLQDTLWKSYKENWSTVCILFRTSSVTTWKVIGMVTVNLRRWCPSGGNCTENSCGKLKKSHQNINSQVVLLQKTWVNLFNKQFCFLNTNTYWKQLGLNS